MLDQATLVDRCQGLLVGTAVGDALGLPREGLSAARARKLFGAPNRHRFLFGRGMTSDDTEHSIFVAQSLIRHPGSVAAFERRLAWALRGWLLSLPAGIGLATLRASLRLWLGFPPSKAGVFSAGNGAAMRAAPIGACFFNHSDRMHAYVRVASRLTHTDPRAEIGARAVAALAAFAVSRTALDRPSRHEFLHMLRAANQDCAEWDEMVERMEVALTEQRTVSEFAACIGHHGFVSGYVFHTVPVVAYAWFIHYGDFAASMEAVLSCGGDADTTGAIIGALAGASVGVSGIPSHWIQGIADWPRNVQVCQEIARRLADVARSQQPSQPVRYFWPGILLRNAAFLLVVLYHGFRRLLPPY